MNKPYKVLRNLDFSRANDVAVLDYLSAHLSTLITMMSVYFGTVLKTCYFCPGRFIATKTHKTNKLFPCINQKIIHLKPKANRLRYKCSAPSQLNEVHFKLLL